MSATNLDLPVLISAEQIRRREFATVRRGYDPEQVRSLLDGTGVTVDALTISPVTSTVPPTCSTAPCP